MKKQFFGILASCSAVAISCAFGVIAATAVDSSQMSAVDSVQLAANVPGWSYPTNASGQTYGSAALASSPELEPDLVLVEATNGKLGYVYGSVLLDAPAFKAPEEALAWQNSHADEGRILPVYDLDGRTLVGEFVISVSEGSLTK